MWAAPSPRSPAARRTSTPAGTPTTPSAWSPSRAWSTRRGRPPGSHTLWAYCHVPNGSDVDMTERIEAQIERFAPGFRDLILGRVDHHRRGRRRSTIPSYVGGDINAGAATLRQTVFRPTARWNPYRTAIEGVYLCSAATPPGGGVHGMCGLGAARAALHDLGRSEPARRRPDAERAPVSFAWYRFRATLRSELSYCVSVVLLVGLLGGLSMGAIAAARSTESSFSDFAASSHVPDLFVLDGVINPAIGLDSAYNPALLRTLSHLPHVERVATWWSSTWAH